MSRDEQGAATLYEIDWWAGEDYWQRAFGLSPQQAIRACRRIRRARYLAGKRPGWMTEREHTRWYRIARRLGVTA